MSTNLIEVPEGVTRKFKGRVCKKNHVGPHGPQVVVVVGTEWNRYLL